MMSTRKVMPWLHRQERAAIALYWRHMRREGLLTPARERYEMRRCIEAATARIEIGNALCEAQPSQAPRAPGAGAVPTKEIGQP